MGEREGPPSVDVVIGGAAALIFRRAFHEDREVERGGPPR